MLQEGDIITLTKGEYRLRASLAGSAYGVVWQASAPGGGADVALKLINRDQMARADGALQERWIVSADAETQFLRALGPWDGRHIVRLLDEGVHAGLPVMALELMGPDLTRHGRGPLPLALTLDWLGQINQALATVHQHGRLYLDLKPANVLTERAGSGVKLADFGTSRLRAAAASGIYTGTASWQAPEQFFPTVRNTYDTDIRSDYFALGAMFYYLATGGQQLRFCSTCGEAWRAHLNAAPARVLAEHGNRIPDTLHDEEADLFADQVGGSAAAPALALLRSLLEQERADRPRHALDISRMIAAIRTPKTAVFHLPRPQGGYRAGSMA
jgi:eukaryotic-like serine/threonine-protein kinase